MKSACSGYVHEHPTLNMGKNELVIIGKIGALFGIKAWLHIHSFTDPIEKILHYKEWYVEINGQWLCYDLIDGRRHGQGVVALLDKRDNHEAAMENRHSRIGIPRSALERLPQDEFYWTDLEGLAVQTRQGIKLGNVLYLYKNSDLDVMVVKHQNKEKHIPFIIHDTVLKVDEENKQIIVDWDVTF